jgi:hypothetical protein
MRTSAIVVVSLAGSALGQCPPQWLPGDGYSTSAFNGSARAMIEWDPDGAGPLGTVLVASASFVQKGQPPKKVAAWDGVSWQAFPQGVIPEAFAVFNGELIAGGFSHTPTSPTIMRWDGTAWQPLGLGVDGVVRSLAVHDGSLFAGGEFFNAGGQPALKIARWDGQNWHDVSGGMSGPFFPMVLSLTSFNGDLIAGGFFEGAGLASVLNIARWDGEVWHALAEGRAGSVDALRVFNGKLVAGGSIGDATGPIAQWDGSSWTPLGSGADQKIVALAEYKGSLYAGGFFQAAGGVNASRVAAWNGQWSALGSGLVGVSFGTAQVSALATFRDELCAAGFFDHAGGSPSVSFARWTDSLVPWIARPPQDSAITAGQTLVLSAMPALGYSNLTFQWRRNGQPIVDGPGGASVGGGTVAGAAGAAVAGQTFLLTITQPQGSDAGSYDVVLTGPCGQSASSSAAVTAACYANCDGSTTAPVLNVGDFSCFLNAFASGDSYANCDGSTTPPVLNVADFSCFLNAFAAGCS